MMKTQMIYTLSLFTAFLVSPAQGDSTVEQRTTPTVQLIKKIKHSVVPIFSEADDQLSSGAGAVIHPSGYILTADHVTRNGRGVAIFGLDRVPYRIVGRLPEKDLALLKVDPPAPLPFLPMARSAEIMEGENVLAVGNPGGRGIVYSLGIVSCASMDPTWPSYLAKTYWRDNLNASTGQTDGRDDYIQFDAASNRGNSGGPLLNAAGELVGIVARKSDGEESINWAIPIDRARRLFDYILQPEEYQGFWLGIETDLLAPAAVVTRVVADSPAARSGVKPGDIITSVGGRPIASGPDFLLAASEYKAGATLALGCKRGEELREMSLTLAEYPLLEPAPRKGKSPGLRYEIFRGSAEKPFRKVPDFSSLQPAGSGTTKDLSADSFVDNPKENYAVRFTGWIDFPAEGHYRLILVSDDGSKLYLGDRLVIDHDHAHPAIPLSRSVRVPKGLVPVRIEYFESRGDRELQVLVKKMDGPSDAPPAPAEFFRN